MLENDFSDVYYFLIIILEIIITITNSILVIVWQFKKALKSIFPAEL